MAPFFQCGVSLFDRRIMYKNFKDITSQKFGRLTAVKITGKNKQGHYVWLCKCECGNEKEISGTCLRRGATKSCGCLQKEMSAKTNRKSKKYQMYKISQKTEYSSWSHMKNRCLNKNDNKYKSWGGRGITVCDRWLKFENFYKDMGKKPFNKYSIDRINNDGNYELQNCRWATRKEQMRNRRNNKIITYQGKTLCLVEWAERLNIDYSILKGKLRRKRQKKKQRRKKVKSERKKQRRKKE